MIRFINILNSCLKAITSTRIKRKRQTDVPRFATISSGGDVIYPHVRIGICGEGRGKYWALAGSGGEESFLVELV